MSTTIVDTNVLYSGVLLKEASGVMIMIHGRGADAGGILRLAEELNIENYAFAAPQADNNTWYPYSFLEPVEKNEPFLSNSLNKIMRLTASLIEKGFKKESLYYLGFSQGACLTLEFAARNPAHYGGIFALSGGLIGKAGSNFQYDGDMGQTPLFLGCSDADPHIPLDRVNMSENIFNGLNAVVTKRIYKNMGHTINIDELNFVRKSILSSRELY
jgi:phospholipase/carboxylesterase